MMGELLANHFLSTRQPSAANRPEESLSVSGRHFRSQSGAVIVEMSIAALFLITFLTMSVQMLYLAYGALSMQFIASVGLRQLVIGPSSGSNIASHGDAVHHQIRELSRKLGVPVAANDVHICPLSNVNCGGIFPGQANDMVLVRVEKPMMLLLFRRIRVSGLAIGRNEPT